jgi:hypothetical protein
LSLGENRLQPGDMVNDPFTKPSMSFQHTKKDRGDADTSLVMTDRFSPDDLGKTGHSVDFNLENDSFGGIVLTFD